jgi:hypothetical protein
MAPTTAADVVIEELRRDKKGRKITMRVKPVEAYRASALTMPNGFQG